MINIFPYKDDFLEFHKSIVKTKKNSKNYPDLKDRLSALETVVSVQYKDYFRKFDDNQLELCISKISVQSEKEALLHLYKSSNVLLKNLKISLTTISKDRILNTCQNCTIGEVSTLDHILPKEDFSEYVVNPLNLFPCCSACNSKKGKFWLADGKRKFLNLYLDLLPTQHFLDVQVLYENDVFKLKFSLSNRYGIEKDLFEIIKSHYLNLELCERFALNADVIITPLISQIKPFLKILPKHDIIQLAKESARLSIQNFGNNYWKAKAEMALLEDKNFISYLDNL